jgi:hypothetical protein
MPLPNELCHVPSSMNIPSILVRMCILGSYLRYIQVVSYVSVFIGCIYPRVFCSFLNSEIMVFLESSKQVLVK